MLLPVLAALIFLLDAALGLITYRFGRNRAISYILWAGGLLSSLLLLLSAIFVLSTPQL